MLFFLGVPHFTLNNLGTKSNEFTSNSKQIQLGSSQT